MSGESKTPRVGSIAWMDLTVDDAERVRDFYSQVVGWSSSPVSMGEYQDFNMMAPSSGSPVAGICHRRGANSEQPSQWMIYLVVDDLERSVARCVELGGKVVVRPRHMGGHGSFCVIQDPAGAVAALFQAAPLKV